MRDIRIFSLLCVVLGGMGQGVVAPKMPELIQGAESLAFTSGLSASLMYLGIYLSTFRYGKLADQGKFHWLLGPGLIAYSAILILMGIFPGPTPILILRFFEGLSLSAIYVAADYALGRLSPIEVRGQWLSYYGVALSIGLILGPLVALLFSTATAPLFLVGGIVALAALPAMRTRIPLSPPEGKPGKLNPAALGSGAAYGFMEAALVALFPILCVQEFHVKPEYCLIVVILAAAASSILWGVISDKFGANRITKLLVLSLFVGPALLIVMSSSPTTIAYTSCALFGVLAGGLYPVGFAWLLESLPANQYGYASGAYARTYGLGSLIGPFAAGAAVEKWGSKGLFATVSIVGLIVLGLMKRLEKNG